jgi:DNA-directed RNA polymerase specialized sigma24 family protein
MKAAYTSFSEGLGFTAYGIVELLQMEIVGLEMNFEQSEVISQNLESLKSIELIRLHYLGVSNELLAERLLVSVDTLEKRLAEAKKRVGITTSSSVIE